jgi:hypothetical protein
MTTLQIILNIVAFIATFSILCFIAGYRSKTPKAPAQTISIPHETVPGTQAPPARADTPQYIGVISNGDAEDVAAVRSVIATRMILNFAYVAGEPTESYNAPAAEAIISSVYNRVRGNRPENWLRDQANRRALVRAAIDQAAAMLQPTEVNA